MSTARRQTPSVNAQRDVPIALYVGLTLADLFVTLPFWGLESNPVVLSLGLGPFLGVKLGALIAGTIVWYGAGVHRSRVGTGVVLAYSVLMGAVVVTNIAYVVWVA